MTCNPGEKSIPKANFYFKLITSAIFISEMGVWKQIAEYLYLRKKDPERPKDKWIGYMHGINRISIFVFLICLVILGIKLLC